MIDNLDQTDPLLCKLKESLPLAARATPAIAASIREQSGDIEVSPFCLVTRVHYLGDEGGILCHLAFDADVGPRAFIVSITHLLFDRTLPLAREIASYRKHPRQAPAPRPRWLGKSADKISIAKHNLARPSDCPTPV